jgi:predicted SAM-dependent methyltransferase
MKVRQLASGILSYVPGMNRFLLRRTGGTESARYCYSVWLRHLVMAEKNGLKKHPQIVAELGPGDSLGMGLASLLSGAELYYALDVVEYANPQTNIKIFDELVDLYKNESAIPTNTEFPFIHPTLTSTRYPSHLLATNKKNLQDRRLKRLRQSCQNINSDYSQIKYVIPWIDSKVLEPNSVDMFISHAVFEHVEDLTTTYETIYDYLKPGGILSAQIDFKSHNTHKEWNGHWTYSKSSWSIIRGKRPFFLNREPHSTHLRLLKKSGFEILCDKKIIKNSNINRKQIAPQFRYLSDEDLNTSGVFIQAQKPVKIINYNERRSVTHFTKGN